MCLRPCRAQHRQALLEMPGLDKAATEVRHHHRLHLEVAVELVQQGQPLLVARGRLRHPTFVMEDVAQRVEHAGLGRKIALLARELKALADQDRGEVQIAQFPVEITELE